MKNNFVFRTLLLFIFSFVFINIHAQEIKPDTVRLGIYITSIHDIDFKQKEYGWSIDSGKQVKVDHIYLIV